MIEIKGKYNTAKVFTDNVDSATISQIMELCNQPFSEGSVIRIMPDCHKGAGCTIGTTMTVGAMLCVNLVGVDIGCGILTCHLNPGYLDLDAINLKWFERLDGCVRARVPSGFNTRENICSEASFLEKQGFFENFRCKDAINLSRARLSVGSLGGGNHFIEVGNDEEGNVYLLVHSGSRNLGKQVAEHYHRIAIQESKGQYRNKELAFITGQTLLDYLNDMDLAQYYAATNREVILREILVGMGLVSDDCFDTVHNYIDMDTGILRKGAVSAEKGERLVIPMNMRDGSFIAIGKGNPDWNHSAPHGAGRILGRGQAKRELSVQEFRDTMACVYSTCVGESTLDESPMAYKPMRDIVDNIGDAVQIERRLVPLYNFKA